MYVQSQQINKGKIFEYLFTDFAEAAIRSFSSI